jgi:VanZ family protein
MEKLFHRGSILPLVFALFIFILSVIPTDFGGGPPSFYFPGMDKVIHAGMYGTLALLVLYGLIKYDRFTPRQIVFNLLLVWLYSAFMELLQYLFIRSRSGEWRDMLANLAGIVLAYVLVFILRKLFISKS